VSLRDKIRLSNGEKITSSIEQDKFSSIFI
jgi:hypothetical protein